MRKIFNTIIGIIFGACIAYTGFLLGQRDCPTCEQIESVNLKGCEEANKAIEKELENAYWKLNSCEFDYDGCKDVVKKIYEQLTK